MHEGKEVVAPVRVYRILVRYVCRYPYAQHACAGTGRLVRVLAFLTRTIRVRSFILPCPYWQIAITGTSVTPVSVWV